MVNIVGYCRVLQDVTVCHSAPLCDAHALCCCKLVCSMMQGVAGCCRVLQGAAGCCSLLHGVAVVAIRCRWIVLPWAGIMHAAVRFSLLQSIAVCCSLLQGLCCCGMDHQYCFFAVYCSVV